jgi:hypothetical protein
VREESASPHVVGGTGGETYRAFKDEMTLPTIPHWILEDVGTFGDRHPGTKAMSVLTVVSGTGGQPVHACIRMIWTFVTLVRNGILRTSEPCVR